MYETVKIVKGHEIKRMIGARGIYHVSVRKGESWGVSRTFRTIKAAEEFINKNFCSEEA